MNNVFFENGFLTSTEAENICNVAKEAIVDLQKKLNSIKLYNTYITSIAGGVQKVQSAKGLTDINWVKDAVIKIGNYHSLSAWLKEAIKAKNQELENVLDSKITDWEDYISYNMPQVPNYPNSAEEIDIINKWDINKLNKYYSLTAKAAAIGATIHIPKYSKNDECNLAQARQDLSLINANPIRTEGTGRDTIVYENEPSILSSDIDSLYMNLMAEHRKINAELNRMKAEIKEEMNNLDLVNKHDYDVKHKDYEKKLSEYYANNQKQNADFQEFQIKKKEEISKLKINVPKNLMDTYNEIKSLISE